MRVTDIADVFAPDANRRVVGIRPGEKLHEVLLTEDESRHTFDAGDRFIIVPQHPSWRRTDPDGELLPEGFRYSSDNNERWLTPEELAVKAAWLDGAAEQPPS
jgi:FlaA1/EpsC-like NDP-sugar epimerase